MDVAIQLISSHPILIHAFQKISFRSQGFSFEVMPPSRGDALIDWHPKALWFFILDGCSLRVDLVSLVRRCRRHHLGSRSLILLPPAVSNFNEKIDLYTWGIDGFVDLHETWQAELRRAVDSILQGQLWASREVLEVFAKHEQSLLDTHLQTRDHLTAREQQVLKLVIRGFSNKEIAALTKISGRTAKFHVSNILCKLQLKDRHRLLPDSAEAFCARSKRSSSSQPRAVCYSKRAAYP